jgi:hypothetical protein
MQCNNSSPTHPTTKSFLTRFCCKMCVTIYHPLNQEPSTNIGHSYCQVHESTDEWFSKSTFMFQIFTRYWSPSLNCATFVDNNNKTQSIYYVTQTIPPPLPPPPSLRPPSSIYKTLKF